MIYVLNYFENDIYERCNAGLMNKKTELVFLSLFLSLSLFWTVHELFIVFCLNRAGCVWACLLCVEEARRVGKQAREDDGSERSAGKIHTRKHRNTDTEKRTQTQSDTR